MARTADLAELEDFGSSDDSGSGSFTDPGDEQATITLPQGRRAYVHMARGSAHVNGTLLGAGDAARIEGERDIRVDRGRSAEVLVFDLPGDTREP